MTVVPFPSTSTRAEKSLDKRHRDELCQSGLSEATITECGMYSADPLQIKALLGFNAGCAGMVIPYSRQDDWAHRPYVRIKLDKPGTDGKRYRSATGSVPALYVPWMLEASVLADTTVPLVITEGEKKAIKACQEGLTCVALGGVWAWRTRRDDESIPIPDLDRVTWQDRTVYVVFDSDLVGKPDVVQAERELAKELARRGATVFAIRLPDGAEGQKVGLDDYLMAHTIEEFHQLAPTQLAPQVLSMGLGAFLGEPISAPEPLIEGILSSDGSGWIAGEEKLGKTFYALEEALCLALGRHVCGRFPVPMRQRVLVIEEEDSPTRVRTRIEGLLRGYGLKPDDPTLREELSAWFQVGVWRGFTLDDSDMLLSLARAIKQFRPTVVYVDALRKVTTRDLNKADEANKMLHALDAMRRTYGCLFRIVHHYRKGQNGYRTGRGSQEISGSYVLGAWPETSLFLSPIGKQQGCARVEVQTKDGAPSDPFKITIVSEGTGEAPILRVLAEDMPQGSTDEALREQIMEVPPKCELTQAQEGQAGVTLRTLMKALRRGSEKSVRQALKALEQEGQIKKVGTANKGAALWRVCAG